MTRDGDEIPRPEHPRPQFRRDDWLSLNGHWRFAFDFGGSGLERLLWNDPTPLDEEILVPFCPESALSGIAYTRGSTLLDFKQVRT